MEDSAVPNGFRKKVYTKLTTSKLTDRVSDSISQLSEAKGKKIIPSRVSTTLREGFKQLFLPLLIDIFELRQVTANYKNQAEYEELFEQNFDKKSPEQILEKLESIEKQVKEAQNWCKSVILQLDKGIKETKELLGDVEAEQTQKRHARSKKNFLKSIVNLFQPSRESE